MGFTTPKLLANISDGVVFHIDLTYRIVKQAFPLLVFGISDIHRAFHPMAFMFLSHWCEKDFDYFFISLTELADKLDLSYDFHYIMQDADRASLNSIRKNFPDSTNLMCFFHLMQNVRKHKNLIQNNEYYETVLNEIRELHSSPTEKKFVEKKKKLLKKWDQQLELTEFSKYFQKQWLDEPFSNWAVCFSPPGFSSTNNPIESFNGRIKKFFTNRIKSNLLVSLKNFEEVLYTYYHKEYNNKILKIPSEVLKRGKLLVLSRAKFLVKKKNKYTYTSESKKYNIKIDINDLAPTGTNCDCCYFADKAYCKHLTMIILTEKLEIFGITYNEKFSIRKLQRNNQFKVA